MIEACICCGSYKISLDINTQERAVELPINVLKSLCEDGKCHWQNFFPRASLKSAKTLEVVACLKLLHENRSPLRPPLVIFFTEADY